jgi:ABC-type transport system involved in multi-copper enzyme maturation permease subunit
MSSKAIQERRDGAALTARWQTPREMAPSEVRDVQPWLPRAFGITGLFFFVLGAVLLLLMGWGRQTLFHYLMAPWLVSYIATMLLLIGLGGLLIHAATDSDYQIRRSYMALGFAWILVGLAVSLFPPTSVWGGRLHPLRLPCIFLGLLFLVAFLRNETDAYVRDVVTYLIGGLGAVMAVAGFLFGSIINEFLLSYGIILILLLGLPFLVAFVVARGEQDDLAYYAGLGMAVVGALAFIIAIVRSILIPALARLHWIQHYTPYMMPYGLILMAAGLLYLLVAAGVCSDRQLVVLTRRELASIFFSPIAYVVLMGITFIAWWLFVQFFLQALWTLEPDMSGNHAVTNPEPVVASYFLAWFPIICLIFAVPVVTMRLLSEEHRTGTLEMALTAPMDEAVIVVSKLLAALVFFIILWLPFALFLVGLRVEGGKQFDYTPVLAFYVVLLVTGAGFLSMGVFFSSLTKNQIAAAILTFVGMVVMTLVFFIKRMLPTGLLNLRDALTHISFVDLWFEAVQGKLKTVDLLFWLSATVFWLYATVKVLESRKWR